MLFILTHRRLGMNQIVLDLDVKQSIKVLHEFLTNIVDAPMCGGPGGTRTPDALLRTEEEQVEKPLT